MLGQEKADNHQTSYVQIDNVATGGPQGCKYADDVDADSVGQPDAVDALAVRVAQGAFSPLHYFTRTLNKNRVRQNPKLDLHTQLTLPEAFNRLMSKGDLVLHHPGIRNPQGS